MTVTTLDRKTALILVDLQQSVVLLPTAHPMAGIIDNANRLVDAFHAHDLPVVLVTVEGGAPGRTETQRPAGHRPDGWADLAPELHRRPEDIGVVKRTWGAFMNTDLHERLSALGVTQVVIGGVATSIGVESTARQAHEHGYNVTLATDAMTDMSPQAHENSVARIFPRLGETGTTDDVLALLTARD